ncbi:MAG: urate hydroxylase PuuD [Candidatus Parcubacteria bacterium]|nr:urate hydroxylase PuuD [Burkholderiales bacterium]
MSKITDSLPVTIVCGIILTIIMVFVGQHTITGSISMGPVVDVPLYVSFLDRWLHVISGVMWIGLLWYFNFVQIPSMPKIPDEQKPAVGKVIAPEALFWFRWAALATVVTGVLLATMNKYIGPALSLQAPYTAIGAGMWIALIMAFNVWFIIWPNQKKALGIVPVEAAEKAAAARMAMLTSRANTMLSIPMLYLMVAQQNGGL